MQLIDAIIEMLVNHVVIPCQLDTLQLCHQWTSESMRDTGCGETLKFIATKPPAVELKSYFQRFVRYTSSSEESWIGMLIIMKQWFGRFPHYQLCEHTIHRLALVSLMVASKLIDDFFDSNFHWANVGGVNLRELNQLEVIVLFEIIWHSSSSSPSVTESLFFSAPISAAAAAVADESHRLLLYENDCDALVDRHRRALKRMGREPARFCR